MFLNFVPFLLLSVCVDTNWPAFLGSGADPRHANELPLEWSPSSGVKWIAEIEGHGQSSPVIWGDRIFVTSVTGKEKGQYHVTCFDRRSGEKRWAIPVQNSEPVANSYYVSRAAPTPVVDADRLVAFFESGDCICLSHSGELLWQRKLTFEEGPIVAEFGIGASPCQSEDTVYILVEHERPGCLLAISKRSGETLWEIPRPPGRSWSSPTLVEVAGSKQIVVSSSGSVMGFTPKTGEQLWELEGIGGNTGCTPIDCGDGRFLIGASPGRNGENAGSAAKSNCMVQVDDVGDGFRAKKLWVAERAFPSWASPIVHDGFAYWVNRAGVVFCYDVDTGTSIFQKRLEQSCWATPLGAGGRIYFFGKDGLTTVIKSGPKFSVLATNTAWGEDHLPQEPPMEEEKTEQRRRASSLFSKPTVYGYAVSNEAIFLRVGNALVCCTNKQD